MQLPHAEIDVETSDILSADNHREGAPQSEKGDVPDVSCILVGGLTHVWTYYDNESPPFYETPCGILLMCPDLTEGDITCLACLATR